MAEQNAFPTNVKIIETKICNRIDDLNNWKDSDVILAPGEIALAIVTTSTKPDGHGGEYLVPTVMMKVGNGVNTFGDLHWLAAPASDVYAWAKNPTIDGALAGSSIIEVFEEILEGIGSEGDIYATVLEAIAGEIAKFESTYSGANATGIITGITVTYEGTTVERRQISNSDITDETISQSKIEGLTNALTTTDNRLEQIESMLDASGKVMEFVGTYEDKASLDDDSKDGILNQQSNHILQKGDVVATTTDAKEYIWTTTTKKDDESDDDFNARVIYTEQDTEEGVTSYTYYYWEEFGHANATDEALAKLKDKVETFHDKVFYDDSKYTEKTGTIQHAIEANNTSIEEITKTIDGINRDLDSNFPKRVEVTETINNEEVTNNYLTFNSVEEESNDTPTGYIIFNCGTAAPRLIDKVKSTPTPDQT